MVECILIVLVLGIVLFTIKRRKGKSSKTAYSQGIKNAVSQDGNEETSDSETVSVPAEFPVYWFDGNGNRVKGVAKMAQGIQVFDENGGCVLDLTYKLTRILGSGRTYGNSGTLADANIQGENCWAIATNSHTDAIAIPPIFSASNGVLSWTYPSYSGKFPYSVRKLDCDFIYGTF